MIFPTIQKMIKTEELVQIGKGIKSLKEYWTENDKTLYLERQGTKGVFIPIYKNEIYHLARVLLRVSQSKLHKYAKKDKP